MELDELKNSWEKAILPTTPINQNITEMIYHSNGPLATLEKKLKYTIYIFPFVVILFAGVFLTHSPIRYSPTHWLLFTILLVESMVAIFNLTVVKKMRQPFGNVKENLFGKINIVHRRLQWYMTLHMVFYLVMAILLEFTIHYHWDTNFNGWGLVNPVLRISFYILFLIAQYFIRRRSQQANYGQYLQKLQQLVQQMHDPS